MKRLCNESAGGGGLVSPGWWEGSDGLVVTGETVDTGLDKNQAELSIFVLAVTALEMLAYGDGLRSHLALVERKRMRKCQTYLLDQHVKIFWNLWGETWKNHNVSHKDQSLA